MTRIPRNIVRQAIDTCDVAGFVKSYKDEFGIAMMVNRCFSDESPMWRTNYSSDCVASKEALNLPVEGVGVLTTKQMRVIAPIVGRAFVFDYISGRGYEGARLCLPKDVPAGFNPEKGIAQGD